MDVSIDHRPAYSTAKVVLAPGEAIKAEAGAMIAMRGDLAVETATGGLGKALKRTLLGGESLFQNTYRAQTAGGVVWLASPLPGDVTRLTLAGESLVVQDGSYLASHPDVVVDTRWQGARGFFAGEGFVMLHVSGRGDLLLSSYGAIEKHELRAGETLTVDTGHLVAFTDGMEWETQRFAKGVKSMLFSGEGVVSVFHGPGSVWIQTRSSQNFLNWLARRVPGGGGSGGGRGLMGGLLGE